MSENSISIERINSLMAARQQSYAAFHRYRTLLSAEAAKMGIDADWIDRIVQTSLHNSFVRQAQEDFGKKDVPDA